MTEHPEPWDYPHFSPEEMASPDTGQALMSPLTMRRLEILRTRWGRSLHVTSGYRTAAHNAKVGGSSRSAHLMGRAVDIAMTPSDMPDFVMFARLMGFTGIGVGKSFIYLDDLDGSDRARPGMWTY